MTLVPSVTELILAELLYLQYEDDSKPIQLYINSTGTSKVLLFKESLCFPNFNFLSRRDKNMVMIQKHLLFMTQFNM